MNTDKKEMKNKKLNKKKNSNGINKSLIIIIFVPLIIMLGLIDVVIVKRIKGIVYDEAKEELRNTAFTINYMIDSLYPGEYAVKGKEHVAIIKGEKVLNGNYELIDEIKEGTGYEISIFYQNTRILSTIKGEDGERIIGSTIRKSVLNKVFDSEDGVFYDNIGVNGEDYVSYYYPIRNGNENVGMVAVLRETKTVENKIWSENIILLMISITGILLVGLISYNYSKNLISRIGLINKFLIKISSGSFKEKMDSLVHVRNDEISEMGKVVEKMSHSIQNLVEMDALTEINNRRYGDKYLVDVQEKYIETGVPFSIAILDIDFFKKVNDTYGHLAGDMVLKEIARIIKEGMIGKGFACRWGGEEFLLVFNKDKLDDAYFHIKEIVKKIKSKEIIYNDEKIRVTVTCGIVEGNKEPIHVIVKKADDKLYKGKTDGRDRIVK